jgi:DNA-binding HxlR family transcriptional regulator
MPAPSSGDFELSRLILEVITSKWTLLVLDALCSGPMRFNALRRANRGVTQKALTQCLRRLEENGFVKRSVVNTAPVAVVYEISPLGRSLEPHLRSILKWADEHGKSILAAREAFASLSELTYR